MTIALIRKELRQHWLPFLLIGGLISFGFLLILGVNSLTESGSIHEALRIFLTALLPLGVLVLCNRLVVQEYQCKTQLFLESLPLPRSRMIAVKYLLGLAFVLLSFSIALLITTLASLRTEPPTASFLGILIARGCTYSWCLYSFFFMMGLMGRYRAAIYIVGLVGVFALDTMTEVELGRFGPFALINERFAFERVELPRAPLLESALIGLGLVGLTFALALVREGSIATVLSEKMTHREKITITVAVLVILVSISVYDERVEKKQFDLVGAAVAERGKVRVKVSGEFDGQANRAERLAAVVADEVSAMQQYLKLDDPPPIFISHWGQLDSHHFEHAELEDAEGLLVRANFANEDWEDDRFLDWFLRELLIVWSHERLEWEPNRWVLDGFATYWRSRRDPSPPSLTQLELRAAYGARQGLSANDIDGWLTYRDRVGEDIAAAVAWLGLEVLEREQGDDRCQEFLKAALDCSVPDDVRGMLHDWFSPVPTLLERHAGIAFPEFVDRWSDELAALVDAQQESLAEIPIVSGEVTFEAISSYTHIVRFNVNSDPPPVSGRLSLVYAELPAFAVTVEPNEIRREVAGRPDQTTWELPGTFARGTRFYSTFAVWAEPLGCEVISGWTRTEAR